MIKRKKIVKELTKITELKNDSMCGSRENFYCHFFIM